MWFAGVYVYLRPTTLEEALEALYQSRGELLAGGTDFYPVVAERLPAKPIVDITRVRELKGITRKRDLFRIGGGATWTELVRAPLPRCFDALKAAAREIGSVQIQNCGTVAGNLCNASPAADSVPALLVLDAEVELVSTGGARRLPLAQFITGNRRTQIRGDEVLTAVLVPRQCESAASAFLKLGARKYLVISISMVAVILETNSSGCVSQARVAVGSCSAVARRLFDFEKDLLGQPADPQIGSLVVPQHLSTLSPIDDIRAASA